MKQFVKLEYYKINFRSQIKLFLYNIRIHLFYSRLPMRQKTHYIKSHKQDQRQQQLHGQLEGWNNDLDDLASCNNLLKILQKKITFPVLQNIQNFKKKNVKKLQSLPEPIQISKRKYDRYIISKNEEQQHVQTINIQKLRHSKQVEKKTNLLLNSKTQKIKLNNYQILRNVIEPAKEVVLKKQNKNSQDMKNGHYFFKSPESQSQQQIIQQTKRVSEILKPTHKKIISTSIQMVKPRLATFDQYGAKQENAIQQKSPHKRIKWDRFSMSQQKFSLRQEPNKSNCKFIPIINEKLPTRQKKLKEKSKQQESYSKMIWLEKMLHKGKLSSQNFVKRKIIKTQVDDFMDEHLQSPIPKARLHTNL